MYKERLQNVSKSRALNDTPTVNHCPSLPDTTLNVMNSGKKWQVVSEVLQEHGDVSAVRDSFKRRLVPDVNEAKQNVTK